jgi:hypothetical protein
MKLELKHLAGYLPYDLKGFNQNNKIVYFTLSDGRYLLDRNFKPILRPLSDLTQDNADFLSGDGYMAVCEECVYIDEMRYSDVLKLIERHFDIYGLIENGLAIDINML